MKADIVELVIYLSIAVIGFFLGLYLFVGFGTSSSSVYTWNQDTSATPVVVADRSGSVPGMIHRSRVARG